MIEAHEYLWTDGNTVLYVGRQARPYDFRVFTGSLGEPLREIEATHATRLRDGGTTYITTAQGELFAPRPASFSWMGTSDFPVQPCRFSWSDGRAPLELPRVNPADYDISIAETSRTAVVIERTVVPPATQPER